MCPININLPSTVENVPKINLLNSYLPLRNKGNDFSWDTVVGLFLGSALHQEIKEQPLNLFIYKCKEIFNQKLDAPNFWYVLEKMYFENEEFYKLAPECLLFRAQKSNISAVDKRVALMYCTLLNGLNLSDILKTNLNFLEKQIVDVLKESIVPGGLNNKEDPYLPFLSEYFCKDLQFLSSKPKYMLNELQNFLSIYGFLYCSQLALNIREWRVGIPKSKPLYFIMDNEKASSERTDIQRSGWRSFNDAADYLFPMLSMLENLQEEDKLLKKKPLWRMAELLKLEKDSSIFRESIKKFACAFKAQRNLNTDLKQSDDVLEWLDNLMLLARDQFKKGLIDSTRHDINKKYVKEIESKIGGAFIQSRGRAGRVLVLNQDNIILLTNIAIGIKEKLRFHELVLAFEGRGIYFDKQSKLKLIEFYERIGNVDRMSDSGDAIYVRKTV